MVPSPQHVPWLLRIAASVIATTAVLTAGLHGLAYQSENAAARARAERVPDLTGGVLAAAGKVAAATQTSPAAPLPAGPAPSSAPVAAAAPPPNPAVVQQARHLVGLAGDHDIGVLVVDSNGAVVVDYKGNDRFVPASTAKTLTAAAALVKLGPDFRYQTRVFAPHKPDGNGVLHGDLVLVGSGDPVLSSPLYQEARPERPVTSLTTLADAIQGAGIRHVTGGIIGDSSAFSYEPHAPGWVQGHFSEGSAVRASGLTINGGRSVWRGPVAIESAPIGDPSREAADVLKALLAQRGVTVAKNGASSTVPVGAKVQIGQVTSPPLWQILQYMVQRSDNQIADGVFRTIGLVAGKPNWQGSRDEVNDALRTIGVDPAGIAMPDGSGLSRQARVTPAQLTAVDEAMTRGANGRIWLELMATAGHSGTLRNRLVGTPAEGRVRGKTGTLDDVRALSGVVLSDVQARYRFVVIGNDLDQNGIVAVRRLQDDLAQLLATDATACPTGC